MPQVQKAGRVSEGLASMGTECGFHALRIAVKDEADKRAIVKALDTVMGESMYTNSRNGFEFILPG